MEITVTDRNGATATVEGEPGVSLMEVLIRHPFGVDAVCGGSVSCGTCHVYLDERTAARLPPRDFVVEEMLRAFEHRKETSALSCQVKLHEGMAPMRVVVAPVEF